MATVPASIALTSIADGAQAVAADHRNNFASTQTALNALITILAGGTLGQVLQSGGGTTVAWGPAYTSYTPTWTSTGTQPVLGNGTISSRYLQIGKFVHYYGQLTMGSTTTFGTGSYLISLPANIYNGAGGSARMNGMLELFHSGTNAAMIAYGDTSSSVSNFNIVHQPTWGGTRTATGPAAPWTWATSDFMAWNLIYESV